MLRVDQVQFIRYKVPAGIGPRPVTWFGRQGGEGRGRFGAVVGIVGCFSRKSQER